MIIQPLFPKPIGFVEIDKDFTKKVLSIYTKDKDAVQNRGFNFSSREKYVLENKELNDIKTELEIKTNKYFQKVFEPSSDVSLYITQSWLNWTENEQEHHTHTHTNSFISGVYYISTSDDDKIRFEEETWGPFDVPTNKFNMYNSKSWMYPVKENMLILFPSFLTHRVDKLTKKHTRISLAFNTFFKGTLGDYDNATELKL